MKILLCSVPFSPSIGGIETVSALLAEEFTRRRHRVVVVTQTADDDGVERPYRVVRRPSAPELLQRVGEADVVFHNNISLRLGWPLLLRRRPWVVAHHTWIPERGVAARLKRRLVAGADNVCVSQAVADTLPVPAQIVPNPYRADVFRRLLTRRPRGDIAFVGRLVSDKGVEVLLRSLELLAFHGVRPTLTIVGDGPESGPLKAAARERGLPPTQVSFVGARSPADVASILNAHRVLVVPSLWEEPFGLVALEGLACGCTPVVARSGGLPEAAGPHARVFGKGDADELAFVLADVLSQPPADRQLLATSEHLRRHRPERIAAEYLRVLSHALGERRVVFRG